MALPLTANTTCDIYRAGNAPPAAPDVAGVRCHLRAAYGKGLEEGEGDPLNLRFTHLLFVDLAADVRDAYDAGRVGATADTVYTPDSTGTALRVVFVERRGRGSPGDHKKVYLSRTGPGAAGVGGPGVFADPVAVTLATDATSSATAAISVTVSSTGTPAAGFGVSEPIALGTTTGTVPVANVATTFTNATGGSQTVQQQYSLTDHAHTYNWLTVATDGTTAAVAPGGTWAFGSTGSAAAAPATGRFVVATLTGTVARPT
jgi:hypothetical protein